MAGGLLAATLCAGCIGLFKPEDPEPPTSNNCSESLQSDLTSPTTILETISSAMSLKSPGRCAYIAVFADSLRDGYPYKSTFPPELVDERERVELPVPAWRRNHELAFYDDFMEISAGSYTFQWLPWPEAGSDLGNPANGDSTLHRRYQVTPAGGAVILATGVADLVFKRLPSGDWVLVEWRDLPDPNRSGDLAERLNLTISQRRLEAYDATF
jgi:hypothetical protein